MLMEYGKIIGVVIDKVRIDWGFLELSKVFYLRVKVLIVSPRVSAELAIVVFCSSGQSPKMLHVTDRHRVRPQGVPGARSRARAMRWVVDRARRRTSKTTW